MVDSQAEPSHRSPRVLVAVAAAILFVVAGGAALALFLTRDTGPHYPKQWDSRVTDIVSFDEATRGLKYKHPVEIEFMNDDAFTKTLGATKAPTAAEKTQIDQLSAGYRALGLISGDVDLYQQTQDLQSGGTLAYYDPKTKKIRVRGTDMTPGVRVTLAHEMTHVLQDQYFDLGRLEKTKDDGERTAFRAVVEGDAVGIEKAYIAQLSAADAASYESDSKQSSDTAGYDKSSQVLVANFTSPYIIGPPFVATLKAKGGNPAIDDAIKRPPASEAALLDIFTYFADQVPVSVETPSVGAGEKKLDTNPLGATTWYLMLARRLPGNVAAKAVDGWAGDSALTYSQADGTVCVRARYDGKTSADTGAMADLLRQWVAQGPADSASTTTSGAYVELNACDPGKDAQLAGTDQSVAAIELLAVRLQVVQAGFEQGATATVVDCISNKVLDQLTLADLASDADPTVVRQKLTGTMISAVAGCR
jgi:hypothetical protein